VRLWFDLKRQNVLTTILYALQSIQTGEVTSRGIELEAVPMSRRS